MGDPIQETWRWKYYDEVVDKDFHCIEEAPNGDIWFGTGNGVLRYSGLDWEYFKSIDSSNSSNISDIFCARDGKVFCTSTEGIFMFDGQEWHTLLRQSFGTRPRQRIAQSADGKVWFGTNDGIWFYEQGEMIRGTATGQSFISIIIDREDYIWFTTPGAHDIYRCPAKDVLEPKKWRKYEINQTDGINFYTYLLEDSTGSIWYANNANSTGVYQYDSRSDSWNQFDFGEGGIDNIVTSMTESPDGSIWIVGNKGLTRIRGGSINFYALIDLNVSTFFPFLFATKNNFLFIGSLNSRLYGVDLSGDKWSTFENIHYQCQSENGDMWFLSKDAEIVVYRDATAKWKILKNHSNVISNPVRIHCSQDQKIWIIGNDKGTAALNLLDGGVFKHTFPKLGEHLSHLSLIETDEGALYFGAGTNPFNNVVNGAILKVIQGPTGTEFKVLETEGPARRAVNIVQLNDNEIITGGPRLYHFRLDPFIPISTRMYSIPLWWVERMILSEDRKLWIAQWGIGLHQIDLKTGEQKLFTEQDGLKSNRVTYVFEDKDHVIWAVTEDGVSRFDGATWVRNALHEAMGFSRTSGTLHQSKDGRIWINKARYAWYYRGTKEEQNLIRNRPDAVFEFGTISYQPDGIPPITSVEKIGDDAGQSSNEFRFRCIGFDPWSDTSTADLQYSYRINEGAWSPYQYQTNYRLRNLDPGEYKLEVRSRDIDFNIDPNPASISFKIPPPFWQTPWFIALNVVAALVFISLIAGIIYLRVRHVFEIEELKIQYFTELSHDLRTPLTLIASPVKEALHHTENELQRSRLNTAAKYVDKLTAMIDDILDFRAAQSKQLQIENQPADLVSLLQVKVDHFRSLISAKKQILRFDSNSEECWLECDGVKIEKTLDNLISNASKYSDEHATIAVALSISELPEADQYKVILSVTDDGIGIPKNEQGSLFKAFYRTHQKQREKGTGLGLALTARWIERMGGKIEVESPVKQQGDVLKGTRFRIELYLQKSEKLAQANNQELTENGNTAEGPRILVVEDQADIRSMLANELSGDYEVTAVRNGKIGWELCQQELPDLVLSDVMMPEMDGFELCKKIKSTGITSHIPVLLLTAKSEDNSVLKGLETGADEYLIKPPNIRILKARVANLLESRKALRKKWKLHEESRPETPLINSANQAFLEEIRKIINENLNDHEFGNKQLAEKMHLTTRSLHRKLTSVTNQSPSALIRELRLQKAKNLLLEGSLNVSEILEQVGYLEHSYFSSSFKKRYGCSPREFQKKHSAL
ncbi:MAG: response regulator [Opitutales bacterium]|nr:response regulator [Opitutales bacterium]